MTWSLVLALASAAAWGAGDFFGGFATSDSEAVGTTLTSQYVGLLGLLVAALFVGGTVGTSDLVWGTLAGLSSMAGLALFYEAMGMGSFGPVASIASVMSALLPIGFGLLGGERPATLALVGVGLAVVAVWRIAGGDGGHDGEAIPMTAKALAGAAGLFFGGFFVLLSRTSAGAGLWPIVAGRAAASVALGVTLALLVARHPHRKWTPTRRSIPYAMLAGGLDATANALYLVASRGELLAIVAVLASMYPASTALIARFGLGERLNARQRYGMGLGLIAVALIAV